MLRKLALLASGLLLSLPSLARADDVIEPYGTSDTQAPPAPPPQAPPVVVQPVPVVPVTPPPQYYPYQYQYQYYPPPPPAPAMPYCAQAPCGPVRYKEITQPRYGLMTAGLIVLGASWSINAISAYLGDEWRLAIPVAGPFMYANQINTSDDFGTRTAVTFLVLDGLVETAGAAMFFAGILTHHKVRVMEHAKVTIVPTAGYARIGLAAFARF